MVAALLDYFLPAGIIKRIHVNQHKIRRGDTDPITIQTSKGPVYAHELDVVDENGKVVLSAKYQPENPLSCGAKLWLETTYKVVIR